jgi:hypothetical protein
LCVRVAKQYYCPIVPQFRSSAFYFIKEGVTRMAKCTTNEKATEAHKTVAKRVSLAKSTSISTDVVPLPRNAADLHDCMEQLMGESEWLERRRPIVKRLADLVGGVETDWDATRYRAMTLLLDLIQQSEGKTDGAYQPPVEDIDEAIAILTRMRDKERDFGNIGDAATLHPRGENVRTEPVEQVVDTRQATGDSSLRDELRPTASACGGKGAEGIRKAGADCMP